MNIKESVQDKIKELTEYGVKGMKWGKRKYGVSKREKFDWWSHKLIRKGPMLSRRKTPTKSWKKRK